MLIPANKEIYSFLKNQLALDFNCKPEDFDKTENVITLPALNEKRRVFSKETFFLQMATLGNNTVISADQKLHPWLAEWVKGKTGFWLFEQHNYFELNDKLREFGYKLNLTHHMFLPVPELVPVEPDFEYKFIETAEIMNYYGREEFPNAIYSEFKPERPDVLAVVAIEGEKIMGMAGCSADSPELWQIGIDVLPEYRGRGIGSALVKLLRNETFCRGAIPYYGTSLSNLGSWKIALASGFKPAWVESETSKIEMNKFKK
jgi:GNAT superfamily N-acetyltransferase